MLFETFITFILSFLFPRYIFTYATEESGSGAGSPSNTAEDNPAPDIANLQSKADTLKKQLELQRQIDAMELELRTSSKHARNDSSDANILPESRRLKMELQVTLTKTTDDAKNEGFLQKVKLLRRNYPPNQVLSQALHHMIDKAARWANDFIESCEHDGLFTDDDYNRFVTKFESELVRKQTKESDAWRDLFFQHRQTTDNPEEHVERIKELLAALPNKSWDEFLRWYALYSWGKDVRTRMLEGTVPADMEAVFKVGVQIQAANRSGGKPRHDTSSSATENKSAHRLGKQPAQKAQASQASSEPVKKAKDAQREKDLAEGNCLICHQQGHRRHECPRKAAKASKD